WRWTRCATPSMAPTPIDVRWPTQMLLRLSCERDYRMPSSGPMRPSGMPAVIRTARKMRTTFVALLFDRDDGVLAKRGGWSNLSDSRCGDWHPRRSPAIGIDDRTWPRRVSSRTRALRRRQGSLELRLVVVRERGLQHRAPETLDLLQDLVGRR